MGRDGLRNAFHTGAADIVYTAVAGGAGSGNHWGVSHVRGLPRGLAGFVAVLTGHAGDGHVYRIVAHAQRFAGTGFVVAVVTAGAVDDGGGRVVGGHRGKGYKVVVAGVALQRGRWNMRRTRDFPASGSGMAGVTFSGGIRGVGVHRSGPVCEVAGIARGVTAIATLACRGGDVVDRLAGAGHGSVANVTGGA